MEKFTSQQSALRAALTQVLGEEPKKYQLVITAEQRKQVGELMIGWLKQDLWSIRPGTRAAADPLNYVVGKQPTCLIEAWVQPKQPKAGAAPVAPPKEESKFDLLKKAVDAGLISKEDAQKKFFELLNS